MKIPIVVFLKLNNQKKIFADSGYIMLINKKQITVKEIYSINFIMLFFLKQGTILL